MRTPRSYSHYPNGFANGVTIRGLSVLNQVSGDIVWVDSGAGADGNKGTIDDPLATLDAAIGLATANNGDVIVLKAGHAETIIADSGVDIDVAGLTIIGLGNGADRPTFTFTTAITADFKIAAAGVSVDNLLFTCGIDAQEMMIEVSGVDASITNCEFREGTALQALNFITIGTADNDADRALVADCKFHAPTAGDGDSAINIPFDHIGVEVKDNDIYGDFDLAGIDVPAGGNAQVNMRIVGNRIENLLTGQHAIQVSGTASTGLVADNKLVTDAFATAIDPGGLTPMGNTWNVSGDNDTEATPALALADNANNFIGVDDADNAAATTNVVANEDGSILERLEQIQEAVNKGTGSALATNESVVDVLYAANGIATFPAAAAPANSVSIAEVIRESYDQQDKSISGSTAVMTNGDTIFTITGGPIEIIDLVSEAITLNDATASTLQYSANPTVGAATTFSGASVSLANAAAGSGVVLNGTALTTAPDVVDPLVSLGPVKTRGIIVAAGIITIVIGVGTTTGTWKHRLRYRPLDRGVTVTAT